MLAWIKAMALAILLCAGALAVVGGLAWFLFLAPLARM